MLRITSLVACLAGLLCAIAAKATGRHGRQACPASLGRRVSQIAAAIFLPRPDAKALGDSVRLGGFGLRRTASSLVRLASYQIFTHSEVNRGTL